MNSDQTIAALPAVLWVSVNNDQNGCFDAHVHKHHGDDVKYSRVSVDGAPTVAGLQRRLYEECVTANWDPERKNTFAEEIAHLHEELSEAFRAWRRYKDCEVREVNGKLEGVPVEFADALIGMFYNAELYGFDLLAAVERKHQFNLNRNYVAEGRQLHADPGCIVPNCLICEAYNLPVAASIAATQDEQPTRREIRSSRHPHFTATDHQRMKEALDALSDYPTEEEAEAALQACGTSGREVVNEFIERLLKENLELKQRLEAAPSSQSIQDAAMKAAELIAIDRLGPRSDGREFWDKYVKHVTAIIMRCFSEVQDENKRD